MSWLRYSDDFTEWPEWDMAPVEARWAFVCLVQACSRGKYWDGRIPKRRALACLVAQVDDPQQVLERLAILSLIHEDRREQVVILPRIHEFIPPPHVRTSKERTKVRVRRHRAHQSGDHSECLDTCPDLPASEPVTADVTGYVTRYIGTGRDGTGKAVLALPNRTAEQTGNDAEDEEQVTGTAGGNVTNSAVLAALGLRP